MPMENAILQEMSIVPVELGKIKEMEFGVQKVIGARKDVQEDGLKRTREMDITMVLFYLKV